MILVCKDLEGKEFRVKTEDVREIVPCQDFHASDLLTSPTSALLHYHSHLLPLRGPVPAEGASFGDAWILIYRDHGRIVADLPDFGRSASDHQVESEDTAA
jgi:hypothetical protein